MRDNLFEWRHLSWTSEYAEDELTWSPRRLAPSGPDFLSPLVSGSRAFWPGAAPYGEKTRLVTTKPRPPTKRWESRSNTPTHTHRHLLNTMQMSEMCDNRAVIQSLYCTVTVQQFYCCTHTFKSKIHLNFPLFFYETSIHYSPIWSGKI